MTIMKKKYIRPVVSVIAFKDNILEDTLPIDSNTDDGDVRAKGSFGDFINKEDSVGTTWGSIRWAD